MLKYFSSSRRSLPEFLLAGLILVLALSYGAFGVFALHSARSGGTDFYVTTNPWEPASPGQAPADHRLAFRAAPSPPGNRLLRHRQRRGAARCSEPKARPPADASDLALKSSAAILPKA
jgi:hypothetical protein